MSTLSGERRKILSFLYEKCVLCGRKCGVDRRKNVGYCKMTDKLYVARASIHMWEEPIISGTKGSGTIFFSGCSLGCIYCQNKEISRGVSGIEISTERLSKIMCELKQNGAHNINLVTPTHFVPSIKEAVLMAREKGMKLPIVYNTSSYDSIEALSAMDGIVDIYLADLKYHLPRTGKLLSGAENYTSVAKSAIAEMVRQTGEPVLSDEGLLLRGTVVRILLLPSHVAEAKLILKHLSDRYGDKVYISLMNQYTPSSELPAPLNRRVTSAEYRELIDYAVDLGLTKVFTQEKGAASESFIPPFNNTGVIKGSD